MFRFQALLIIFLATIRLQGWGDAVCDPSVGGADSSPWQGRQWRWLAALFSLPLLPRGGGAGAQRMARWGRVSFNNSGSEPLSQQPLSRRSRQLPLAGEPRAVACGAVLFASPAKGRWGRRAAHGSVGSRFFRNPSVSGADSSPWQGSQGRWLAALFSLPPLPRGGGAGAQRMARWGRVSFNNSGSEPLRFATPPVRKRTTSP